jgi:hypothetical protein
MTRTDELLGYAQGFRPQPAAVRSAALHCTNPLLGFASNPSYLIGLRPMAEREGFEPSVELPPHILSRDAQSATLSPLLGNWLNKLIVALRSIEIDLLDKYLRKRDLTHFCSVL